MMRYRAVRCILDLDDRYLLAIHHNYLPGTIGKWGLPGGHIDEAEDFETTAQREMFEEFGISLSEWQEVADYPYRGFLQKVLSTQYQGPERLQFDPSEMVQIAWFSFAEIKHMHEAGHLLTGFELDAISRYKEAKL